ncbi:hypothetical protein PAXRUDRAFT_143223, partial [Paxillus rubicundulus Ve08.2h10]
RSLCILCCQAEEKIGAEKKYVHLSHITLKRRLEGGRSCQQANEENHGWLTCEEEEKNIIKYCPELAERGFPLTHKTLKHHVDTLLHAQFGAALPESRVGKKWMDRFLHCHADGLHKYWSSVLDTKWGCAVNEHTHKVWCDLLKSTIDEHGIGEDCLWAADETGFQPSEGQRQWVIGAAKWKIQHQQHDGN